MVLDGGGGPTRRLSCCLDTEFTLSPGQSDIICVDLEENWSLNTKVERHPSFDNESLQFVKGEVGEGGDNLNVTFKNVGEKEVTIGGKEVVVVITEEDNVMEQCESKDDSNTADGTTSNQKPVEAVAEESSTDTTKVNEDSGDKVSDQAMETESDNSDSNSTNDKKQEAIVTNDTEITSTVENGEETTTTIPPFRDETQSTPDKQNDDHGDNNGAEPSDDETSRTKSNMEDSKNLKTNDDETDKDSNKSSNDKDCGTTTSPETDESKNGKDCGTTTSPKMRFVNESEEDKEDAPSKDDAKDKEDTSSKDNAKDKEDDPPNQDDPQTEVAMDAEDGDENSQTNGEVSLGKSTEEKGKTSPDESKETPKENEEKPQTSDDKKDDKPTLKLASFSSMDQPSQNTQNGSASPVKGEAKAAQGRGSEGAKEDACSHCARVLTNIFHSIVWETMQFCDENCLGQYQSGMSHCSSCRKDVQATSLGKYCVRFGSDIKQFCSNVCLEDYKKGLKVCSYCQKDISGGEGFLAPIGDKGQFKDFCEQSCLQKYEHMHLGKKPDDEILPCSVCKETKLVVQEILREKEVVKLCSDPCFSAFKFVNSVDTHQCDLCTKHFDVLIPVIHIYYEGLSKIFCSKPCQNVYVMQKRKIVPCSYCKVKKYNFDMIEKFPPGQTTSSNLYCSLNCLSLHNMQMVKMGTVQTGAITQGSQYPGYTARPAAPLPVISAVSSLAVGGQQPQPPLQQQIQVQTQTVREVVKETHVLPSEVASVKNKGMQTKPFMMTKGVSCRPHPCHKETQTEGLTQPVPIPIPVPIHVPTPCKMYNAPFPVPVPIPLPFPVPIFIPTTRHSMKGIEKIIKKILNKIPADPFEAELLALAGDIAGDDDSSDSESDPGDYAKDREYETPLPAAPPPQDLESEMSAEKIIPKPLPISTPDPMDRQRMLHNQGYNMNKRRQSGRDDESDPDDPDGTWRPKSLWEQQNPGQAMRGRRPNRGRGRGGSPQVKRFRADQAMVAREQQAAVQAIQQQPKERPDANHHLKFTYGVNAWKHWVVGKNAELEKQRAQGKYQKTFETDILKLRADELNFTLCMFVKEVKKPNGDCYAADSIFYLVLGIQEYLFENTRIDNIFTDVYYDPFTSALHEVVKDFKLPVNELGYFVTRIEEEHLWESKQLGAHSPHVLLNTLVYFNTKYFQLKTVDQHLKLSFSHIMKHWKKTPLANKPGQQQRTVLLRYYPPPAKGQKAEERKMYEQHENHDNPLRCPVKLYEFYLSKCPESTKNRNDMFYLQPERSCVPDSPVWYSAQLLNRFSMEKMLARLLMVREVQEHMLADQTG